MSKGSILIIGASSDIMSPLIERIADDHEKVFCHYNKSKSKIEALHSELSDKIVPVQADLADENSIANLLKKVDAPEKIVFASCPKATPKRFKDTQWQDYANFLDVQLKASILILKELLPKMAKAKQGKVLFILSAYTMGVPPLALSPYVTSKYALLGFMKSLASEYAPKNIQINAISPAMIETEFLSELPELLVEATKKNHPMKRLAQPEDITELAALLISDGASYISGANIPVSGGSDF